MSYQSTNKRRGGRVSVPYPPPLLPNHRHPIRRGIGIAVLRLLGWHCEGDLPNIPKAIGVGAPHTSTWDVIVAIATFWAVDMKITWMAKSTLFKPPFGAFMRWLGAIPIQRSKTLGLVDQIVAAFDEQESMVVALSPEGTRQKVERWKTGFYHIAHNASVPLVLVGIDFGQKRVVFREPFVTTGDIDSDIALIKAWFNQFEPKHPDRW